MFIVGKEFILRIRRGVCGGLKDTGSLFDMLLTPLLHMTVAGERILVLTTFKMWETLGLGHLSYGAMFQSRREQLFFGGFTLMIHREMRIVRQSTHFL